MINAQATPTQQRALLVRGCAPFCLTLIKAGLVNINHTYQLIKLNCPALLPSHNHTLLVCVYNEPVRTCQHSLFDKGLHPRCEIAYYIF